MRDNSGTTARATPASHIDLRLTRFARVYLAAIALWLLVLGLFNLRHPSDWSMGDWLINYSGGFVRRGLIGQCALWLGHLHVSPLWAVLLLQWSLYAVVLASVWRMVRPLRWSWWLAAFVFSPATLGFVLLDPPFAFRKEILFFALLALTLDLLRSTDSPTTDPRRAIRLSGLLLCGCAACLLAHEGLIVFFPYLFAALLLGLRSWRRAVAIFAGPALVSAVLFALVSHFPGNASVAEAVCRSIGGTLTHPPSGICGGAIDYLAHDSAYAHAEVRRVMLSGHSWLRMSWLFLLPLLPACVGLFRYGRSAPRTARVLILCSATAWLLSISVFYYGTDWTRWIYIHTFSLLLLMLFAERKHQPALTGEAAEGFARQPGWPRWAVVVSLLVYCLGWELTVYGQRPLYGSFARFVTHNLLRGQQ